MSAGDVGLFIKGDLLEIDIDILGNDLDTDAGFQTAIIMSLFTDRLVDADELPAWESSRRGWWGDLFPEVDGDQIGSRLWLLEREKRTQDNLARAEEFAAEALEWMIEDGAAESVTTSATYDSDGFMVLSIQVQKPGGDAAQTFQYKTKWAAQVEQET